MATPNYSYEKRQRELAKKKKKEEKAKKKTSDHGQPHEDGAQEQGEVASTGEVKPEGQA